MLAVSSLNPNGKQTVLGGHVLFAVPLECRRCLLLLRALSAPDPIWTAWSGAQLGCSWPLEIAHILTASNFALFSPMGLIVPDFNLVSIW